MDEHRNGAAAGHHHHEFESADAAAFIELEGEVLVGFVDKAASRLLSICRRDGRVVRNVIDLGCGPGVGSCRLAEVFDAARVVAVDGSPAMLARAAARAERLGLAERVEPRLAELPDGLAALGRADVVWASMVLHHIGDERAVLGQIRELLEPGGLLVVIEWAGPLHVVPDDDELGRPGIWQRLDAAAAAWFAEMRAALPAGSGDADHAELLKEAGFEVIADEPLTVVLDAPLDGTARRFAGEYIIRARAQLAGHADAADLEALGALIAADGDEVITRRATVRGRRHLYIARR